MKNWTIFVNGIFHSRYKRRSDADGHAAFLRQSTEKLVEVVWDVEISPADRMALVGAVLVVIAGTVAISHRPVSAYEDDGYGYNQRGIITRADADAMQNYAPGQSYHAIKSLLGYPTYRRGAADIYEIANTGDRAADGTQLAANSRLVVLYDDGNRATDWYVQ
jgi:hypothetical protein